MIIRSLALVAGFCAAQVAYGQAATQTDWVLALVDGAPAPYSGTLTIEGTRMSGKAPCNRFTGEILGSPPDITLGPIAATRMACDAMAEEAAYFTALGAVTQLLMADGVLILSGAGHVLTYGLQTK